VSKKKAKRKKQDEEKTSKWLIRAPLIVLALPVFDTLFAIIRRVIKGKSLKAVVMPDKGQANDLTFIRLYI